MDDSGNSAEKLPIAACASVPAFDAQEFYHYLDDFELTEEQKSELLITLWSIMAAFVDLGFGVSSIQNFIPALAQFSSAANPDDVEIKVVTETFNEVADSRGHEKGSP